VSEPPLKKCHDCCDFTHTSYSRCDACRKKRKPQDRKRTRKIARAVFPIDLRKRVLAMVSKGRTFREIEGILGVPGPQIHSFARKNPLFRRELDDALLKGRDPKLEHGSATPYRNHGCRCPECRQAKAKAGHWARPPQTAQA
jgi:hypothetical protein